MAFVLVTVGLLMIVTGAKGTYAAFGSQIASDFTGSQPFTYWLAAIGAVGALGYIDALKTFSRLFLTLILVSMVLANKGFFAKFTAALKQGPIAPPAGTGAPSSLPSGTAQSMLGAQGQSPGVPGETGTYGQAKANQYFNAFKNFFTSGGQ
jgi:hypothetical protein